MHSRAFTNAARRLALMLTATALMIPRPAPGAEAQGDCPASVLHDEGLLDALRSSGLSDDPDAPWTPDRITAAALYLDPSVRTARWTAEVAIDDATLAAQRPNPNFSLSPERVISAVGSASPWTIAAALAIPLMRRGELSAQREASRIDSDIARINLGAAFWQTRTRTLAALRQVLIARKAEALALRSAQAQAARAANARKRMALGAADRVELASAESVSIAAQADEAARAGQRLGAEYELAVAIGVPAACLATMTLEWPELHEPPDPNVVLAIDPASTAVANRLELKTLEMQQSAAEARWREARAGKFPKTSVTPTATYDRGDRKVGLGADVELPIFHGLQAAIDRADAARREASARLQQRRLEIASDANRGWAEYSARYAQWRSLQAGIAAARAAEDRARRALSVGEGDRPALLQATASRAALEVQSLDALLGALDALGTLEDAIERPVWPQSALRDVRSQPFPAQKKAGENEP